jgi:hypothetical protein
VATAVSMDLDGVTPEQYLEFHRALDPEGQPIEGLILHTVTETPKGVRIFDVWDSPDAFERYAGERMMPAVEQSSVNIQPQPQVQPLYNVWTPRADELKRMGASPMPTEAFPEF